MSADLTLPGFLPRGLSTLSHGDGWTVSHSSEADLRDGLATLWWLHGADVRTEVKVPNCGRIDVLVTIGQHVQAIEVKRRILTPSAALAAFRQVHAYRVFLEAALYEQERGVPFSEQTRVHAVVTAAEFDYSAAAPALTAYHQIDGVSFGEAMHAASSAQVIQHTSTAPEVLTVIRERSAAVSRLGSFLRSAEIDVTTELERVALTDAGIVVTSAATPPLGRAG